MGRAEGTSRIRSICYFRCGGKHQQVCKACNVRDIPVLAIETFVIEQFKSHALDPAAIELAIQMVNAERDEELVKVESELAKGRAAYVVASGAVMALVDSVKRGTMEFGGRAGQGLRARLREREAMAQVLRLYAGDLDLGRGALGKKVLDAQVVAAGYRSLPEVLEGGHRLGAQEERRALLQAVIDVLECRDPRRGAAVQCGSPGKT